MSEEHMAIIIDNGSGSIKAGFGGEEHPRLDFPSIISKYSSSSELIIGKKVNHNNRGILTIKHPIEHGVITDWDGMEKIWRCTFKELNLESVELPILLTKPPCNPKSNSEKMTQMMFETFSVPAMYASISGVLSLFSTGRTSGTVLDSGDGVSNIIPIVDGVAIEHAVSRLDWAGRDLTRFMARILSERGYGIFCTSDELEIVKKIKEELCFVALDFDSEMSNVARPDVEYELPDGGIIKIGNERFRCPEAFFQTHFLGIEEKGIHESILSSIRKCDPGIRIELYGNILLSGGSTMFEGIGNRLHKELTALAPYSTKISIKDNFGTNRKNLPWIGGSILSSMTSFQENWITRGEYEEFGSTIIHRKCF